VPRERVTEFTAKDLTIEKGSENSLKSAVLNNNFCGIMHIGDKTIYLAPLANTNPNYETVPPKMDCLIGTEIIRPIMHQEASENTSHLQLARVVIPSETTVVWERDKNLDDAVDPYHAYCGFALRFEGDKEVALSPTSRSLNLENGKLEGPLYDRLFEFFDRLLPDPWKMKRVGQRQTAMARVQAARPDIKVNQLLNLGGLGAVQLKPVVKKK
jgi:hypothetical protein